LIDRRFASRDGERVNHSRALVRNGRTTMLGVVAMAALACACRASPADDDARSILSAWEAFESAAPADREAALDALEHARCSEASTCADRDACTTYATALVHASEYTAKARTFAPVDAGGNGAATKSELVIMVAAADEAIDTAKRTEPACTEAIRRLHDRRRR
jgi:hypothetical protein